MNKTPDDYRCVFSLDFSWNCGRRRAEVKVSNEQMEGMLQHPDGRPLDWTRESGRSEATAWVIVAHLLGAETAGRTASLFARQILETLPPRGGYLDSEQVRAWAAALSGAPKTIRPCGEYPPSSMPCFPPSHPRLSPGSLPVSKG